MIIGEDAHKKELVMASVYMPYDSADLPPLQASDEVDNCRRKSWELILGYDANAYHTVWGSSGTNRRGRELLEYLAGNNLDILNRSNTPTFTNSIRGEVIDLTLGSSGGVKVTSSGGMRTCRVCEDVQGVLSIRPRRSRAWKLRKRFQAKTAQREYRKATKKARRQSWRKFLGELNSIPEVARLKKILAKEGPAGTGAFLEPDGSFTTSWEEEMTTLLDKHFPGCEIMEAGDAGEGVPLEAEHRDWDTASRIITPARVRWALDSFEPFKSPGEDGLFPALLQHGAEKLVASLTKIFRFCIATALERIKRWCIETGLSVNPDKTELVVFTGKRKLEGWSNPIFYGKELKPTGLVKHLGVILDAKLSWGKQLDFACGRAYALLWATKRICGKTWGIGPAMMLWLYTAVVRPLFMYGALLWWKRTLLKSVRVSLDHLQGLASRLINGATRTTPVAALGVALGLPPLHIMVEAAAMASAHRLKTGGHWKGAARGNDKSHTTIWGELLGAVPEAGMWQDCREVLLSIDQHFLVGFPSKEEWSSPPDPTSGDDLVWFSDGSSNRAGTGAGAYLQGSKTRVATENEF
ncbi:reverse transcriptase [Lasius niger]|uniref:Reverse transcriptase n=1 Tax=Lasius niger TaxID=67767 RepID=A0A0J7MV53_LASNI|nr:reverse transcriptase [Lasius niger]